jgi:hypothetical protein
MNMPASSRFPLRFWPKWPSASRLQVPCRPLTWMRLFASAAVCTPAVQGGGYNPLAQHGRPAVEGLLVFTQSTVRAKQSRIDSRKRYNVRVQCGALLIWGGWQCKSRLGQVQAVSNGCFGAVQSSTLHTTQSIEHLPRWAGSCQSTRSKAGLEMID